MGEKGSGTRLGLLSLHEEAHVNRMAVPRLIYFPLQKNPMPRQSHDN